jgi:hypothetical protein
LVNVSELLDVARDWSQVKFHVRKTNLRNFAAVIEQFQLVGMTLMDSCMTVEPMVDVPAATVYFFIFAAHMLQQSTLTRW